MRERASAIITATARKTAPPTAHTPPPPPPTTTTATTTSNVCARLRPQVMVVRPTVRTAGCVLMCCWPARVCCAAPVGTRYPPGSEMTDEGVAQGLFIIESTRLILASMWACCTRTSACLYTHNKISDTTRNTSTPVAGYYPYATPLER